jgi:hypothetical protein
MLLGVAAIAFLGVAALLMRTDPGSPDDDWRAN